jgi:hypothetical protein
MIQSLTSRASEYMYWRDGGYRRPKQKQKRRTSRSEEKES